MQQLVPLAVLMAAAPASALHLRANNAAITAQPAAEPVALANLDAFLANAEDNVETATQAAVARAQACNAKHGISERCSEAKECCLVHPRACNEKCGGRPAKYLNPMAILNGQAPPACNAACAPFVLPYHAARTSVVPCMATYGKRVCEDAVMAPLIAGKCLSADYTDRHFRPDATSLGNVGGDSADLGAGSTSHNVDWKRCADLELGGMTRGAEVEGTHRGPHKGKRGVVKRIVGGADKLVKVLWTREESTDEAAPTGEGSVITAAAAAVAKAATRLVSEAEECKESDLRVIKGKLRLFDGGVDPLDICQGSLGDCWFLAAMATLAEHDGGRGIVRLFNKNLELNRRGVYDVRLFDVKRDKWVVVRVDDKVPCKKGSKRPMFISSPGKEMWVMLLEKALAKLVGSYAETEGGYTVWGLRALTGNPASRYTWRSGKWKREGVTGTADKFETGAEVRRLQRPAEKATVQAVHKFAKHATVKRSGCDRVGGITATPADDATLAEGRVRVQWHGSSFKPESRVTLQGDSTKVGVLKSAQLMVASADGDEFKPTPHFKVRWSGESSEECLELAKLQLVQREEVAEADLRAVSGRKVDLLWATSGAAEKVDVRWIEECQDKRGVTWYSLRNEKSENWEEAEMFEVLHKHDANGALLGCGGVTDEGKAQGLIKGHAYSVLDVHEGDGEKLVQVRNPWGSSEWSGKWSDGDAETWDAHPKLKEKLHTDDEDGAFWMSWADFAKCWGYVDVVDRVVDVNTLQYTFDEAPLRSCPCAGETDAKYGHPCARCPGPAIGCVNSCGRFWCKCHGPARLYMPVNAGLENAPMDPAKQNSFLRRVTLPSFHPKDELKRHCKTPK